MSKALEVWEQDLSGKAANTKNIYRRNFNRFITRYSLTPDELFELRQTTLKSDDPRDKQTVERMIKVLMSEMQQEDNYSASTCRNVAKALTSFFESQGLPLTMKTKDLPKGAYNGQRLALVEHIRIMWDSCDLEYQTKNRAILMFLKDSGIRISDLAALKVADYLEAKRVVQRDQNFASFNPIQTEKMKINAFIHIGPEAIEALEKYLEERPDKKPEDPLILDNAGKAFTPNSLSQVLIRMGAHVGIKKVTGHSLRKFHTTMLESAGVPVNWIKKLQGKKVGGSMEAYSRPEETGALTEAYIKAYPKLEIFGEQVSTQKLQEQADTIEGLKARIMELENREAYYETIEEKLAQMEENRTIRDKRMDQLFAEFNELKLQIKK